MPGNHVDPGFSPDPHARFDTPQKWAGTLSYALFDIARRSAMIDTTKAASEITLASTERSVEGLVICSRNLIHHDCG